MIQLERYDDNFLARYYGTAHRTGIKFYFEPERAIIDETETAHPGDWIVVSTIHAFPRVYNDRDARSKFPELALY